MSENVKRQDVTLWPLRINKKLTRSQKESFMNYVRQDGRRPAGYVVASESSKSFDGPGVFID